MPERTALRKVGIGGLIAALFLPEAAVVVLLGIAVSWWLAGLLVGSWTALLIVAYLAARSEGFLGRAFGTADDDPLDYSQWTHEGSSFSRSFRGCQQP